jgi:hypothetical protein
MDAAACDDIESLEKQQARLAYIVNEFKRHTGRKTLCVPARFGSSCPAQVAQEWSKKVSTIIANCGGFTHPSVIHFDNGQTCTAPTDGKCHVHLAPLPLPK